MRKLETLEAWVCARALSRAAYRLTFDQPLARHYGLADQIRRASASIPANIAEGYAMGTTAQFVRFLRIALGSATELLTHLELARDLNLVGREAIDHALDLANREIGLLIGLVFTLGRGRRSTPPPSPLPRP